MKITEVRIKLATEDNPNNGRIRAYCSVILDDGFAIHDIKLIDGHKGLFLAMPARKVLDRCPECREKNPVLAKYCNDCGVRLQDNRAAIQPNGHPRIFMDLASPTTPSVRDYFSRTVIDAYHAKIGRAQTVGAY